MGSSSNNLSATWWLHPAKLLGFFIFPIYVLMAAVIPALWPELVVLRARRYIQGEFILLGGASLLALTVGSALGARIDFRSKPVEARYYINERFLLVLGLIAVAAYTIWFSPVLASGTLLMSRDDLNRMPGVTSFTQLGVPFVSCFLYASLHSRQKFAWPLRALFYAVLLLTVGRVYIWRERLALIEVGMAAMIWVLACVRPHRSWLRRLFGLVQWTGPFLGVPLLIGFFMITEVLRSWTSPFYQSQNLDLVDFMISRLVTYYYTALNNGAGLLATSDWPSWDMMYVLNWAYRLPFGLGAFLWSAFGHAGSPTAAFLARFGDEEFNNMSGIFTVLHDIGFVGGTFYFTLLGLLVGMIFRAANKGTPVGIVLYSTMFMACLEVLRVPYLNDARCFVIVGGSLLAITQFRGESAVESSRHSANLVRV